MGKRPATLACARSSLTGYRCIPMELPTTTTCESPPVCSCGTSASDLLDRSSVTQRVTLFLFWWASPPLRQIPQFPNYSIFLEPIKLDRVFPQYHSCEFQGPRPRDFLVVDHAGQGDGQSLARGPVRRVSDDIPILLGRPRRQVRPIKHLLRVPLQPLPDHGTQWARRNQRVLFRKVRVHVWLSQQHGHLMRVRTGAPMQKHKIRVPQRWIVQNRFQFGWPRPRQVKIISAPLAGLNVDCHG